MIWKLFESDMKIVLDCIELFKSGVELLLVCYDYLDGFKFYRYFFEIFADCCW